MPINNPFKKKYTTEGMYIGKPEAEAERVDTHALFQDYLDIENNIKRGNFIITGRKGAGKSAYAIWLQNKAEHDDQLFCSLVKKDELALEEMIQAVDAQTLKYEALFEWIILVRIVKLVLDSKTGAYLKQISALERFYEKNAGWVSIDKYVIKEILTNKEVNFSPLKGEFGFFSRFLGNKSIKAPFYQMISPLRETLIQVLKMEIFKNINFLLLFDDLDIKFKLTREADRTMLMDLIRIARRYNTEYFVGTNAKVLLFIRDDIGDRLEGVDSDKSKIFGSYEYCINWYEHDIAQKDETAIMLRKFINHRLALSFERCNIPYNNEDPWLSFVEEEPVAEGQKTQFKYILDHTFYLPRDIINLFKNISDKKLRLPLSKSSVNSLLRDFADVKKQEICDELYVVYDQDVDMVDKLFQVIEKVNSGRDVTYMQILGYLDELSLPHKEFHTLLEYSLLVPVNKTTNHFFFNYREKAVSKRFDQYTYRTPKILKLYFNNRI